MRARGATVLSAMLLFCACAGDDAGEDASDILDVRPAVPASGPLLVLGPEKAEGEVPIDVTSARCDAHALGESKKTYVFQVEIDVGDGPEGVVISPPAATEPEMFQVIVDGCGL